MEKKGDECCCKKFDPKLWDNKKIVWKKKLFIKDKITNFFHIPLNFGGVMKRNMEKIEAAKAKVPKDFYFLEDNFFHSDIYIAVDKAVPGTNDVKLSATLDSKVYKGPYKDAGKFTKNLKSILDKKKITYKKLYYYYPYCPKCAKKYGENFVVILVEL